MAKTYIIATFAGGRLDKLRETKSLRRLASVAAGEGRPFCVRCKRSPNGGWRQLDKTDQRHLDDYIRSLTVSAPPRSL